MQIPEMTPVTSSQIKEVGYDKENETLYVRFKTDKLYAYSDVPERGFKNMILASSAGSYFNSVIRDNYEYKQVEE